MAIKKNLSEIEVKFGKHLCYLRIKRGFDKIEDFGRAFNNGKIHKDISAYEKGKNIQFKTLVRFGQVLKLKTAILLDFNKELRLEVLNNMPSLSEQIEIESRRFASNIKRLREEKFKTQLDFELAVGISRENLTNYENGILKPTLDTIGKFSQALGVEAMNLVL